MEVSVGGGLRRQRATWPVTVRLRALQVFKHSVGGSRYQAALHECEGGLRVRISTSCRFEDRPKMFAIVGNASGRPSTEPSQSIESPSNRSSRLLPHLSLTPEASPASREPSEARE